MKKTLIASAVAAATLSSTAFAMDPATDISERLDSMPEFYGNIQLVWTGATEDDGTTETSTNEFADNGSTLGFKHDHMIADGVKGFLKAELEFNADDKGEFFTEKDGSDKRFAKIDEAYIGIKGDFGSAQFGSDDTVYEWVDIMDMFEAVGLEGELAELDEGDNFQYYSPELAGGLTLGVTVPVDSDTEFGGALAAKYAMDNLEVVLAYALGREEDGAEAGDSFGLGVTFGIEDLTLMAQYESRGEDKAAGVDQDNGLDYYALMAQYAMGANNFALGYQSKSFDADDTEDESGIYVQALHNLSDNMYVYVEYLDQTDVDGADGEDADTIALGATYSF